mmetsp:Transcript_39070/g.72783  ORF Transcript_39070/g.72783 Transcript_39070/m.72783 type:complete len:165 (-) Transcript_39070:92-586(-)
MDDAEKNYEHLARSRQKENVANREPERIENFDLNVLIEYLEDEVKDKDLKRRAEAWWQATQNKREVEPGILRTFTLEGQEALDAYVGNIVARLRDFPFMSLQGGRETGCWVRDQLIAPLFDGHWDFYSNQKINEGFNLREFYLLLEGKNMLLERLRHARMELAI